MRSLLIAQADDWAKLEAALGSCADAVLIDLAVGAERRASARDIAARFLDARGRQDLGPAPIVRINPLGDGETDLDLDAVMPAGPSAILLPRCRGAASIQQLSAKLSVREAQLGLEDGATRIIVAADTADGVCRLPGCAGASARLMAVAWDAESVSLDISGQSRRDPSEGHSGAMRLARDMTLLAAAAVQVGAIDTVSTGVLSLEDFRRDAIRARQDGFVAKLATDAEQAEIANEVFSLTKEELGLTHRQDGFR